MAEVDFESYRRDQYDTSGGYDGPPVGTGYFPPEFRIPVGQTVIQSPIGIPAPPIFPTVTVIPQPAPAGDSASEAAGDSAVQEEFDHDGVIDPWFRPVWTVYEAPEGIYQTNRAPTDWDRVYDEYVVLNAPAAEVVEDVPFHDSIDWGEVAGGILGGVLDPFGVGAAARTALAPPQALVPDYAALTAPRAPLTAGAVMPANGCPPYGPKYAKICLATNVITPLRRRRRRRLLTSSDIKDLAALKAIVGGAALQGAVVQAIRR